MLRMNLTVSVNMSVIELGMQLAFTLAHTVDSTVTYVNVKYLHVHTPFPCKLNYSPCKTIQMARSIRLAFVLGMSSG